MVAEKLTGVIEDINKMIKKLLEPESEESEEGFVNNIQLNDTCMVLIVIYILLFIYKKEVIAMVNKYLK